MYIARSAEEIVKLAILAAAIQFFDNCIEKTIKEVAEEFSVSEKQLHYWKNLLVEKSLEVFSLLKPGRRKETLSSHSEGEKVLAAETVNHIVVGQSRHESKNRKFSPETKEEILKKRDRLKEEHSIPYEKFAELIGIDSGSTRLWSRRLKQEGREGLKTHSRAPKRRPKKLPPELIDKVIEYGSRWKSKHRGRIKLTEFGASFRWKYWKLLAKYGRTNLSDKTIARYLKEADLYWIKEEKPKGKRGTFRYYFSGAQLLIDTTVIKFGKVKTKLISVMDAMSRDIFHQEAFLSEKAEKVTKCIRGSLKKAGRLGLNVLSLLSDHGRSYKARRVWEYLKSEGIYRVFSPPYRPQGKAPLERYFRTVKEGLSSRWEVFILFIKGLSIWVKERIVLVCLNLVLIGFNGKYERTPNPYIDGKSPGERIKGYVNSDFQSAVKKVFEAEEEKSQLKNELIISACEEFGFKKEKAKKYLYRYRKESIGEAAEALRRKLVVAELPPVNRWYYLSKVVCNIEEKKKDAELAQAEKVIYEEKVKVKEREEREKIREEERWYETHPEEVLEQAVEWRLVFWGNEFGKSHYEKEISKNLKKVLMQHSISTAGLKVDEICKRIQEKDKLEDEEVIKSNVSLPPADKLKEAKDRITALIRKTYSECKGEIPSFQGLKQLWRRNS